MNQRRLLAKRLIAEFPRWFDTAYADTFAEMLILGHGQWIVGCNDRTFRGIVELDRAYSPSSCVADMASYIQAYASQSATAREKVRHTEVAYGPNPEERIDYFSTAQVGCPLFIYMHGGYWQELNKTDSAFMAPGLTDSGVNVAVLGYGLAPAYGLDSIVAMVRAGVGWLLDRAWMLGFDGKRVFVGGSSAGAQLASMCLIDPSMLGRLSGAILLSGVYDLAPLIPTYINGAVGMDEAVANRNSPIRHLPDQHPPAVVARAAGETKAFVDQHDRFVAAIDGPVLPFVVSDRNHFDLPMDLGKPDSVLGEAVLNLVGSVR